MARTSELEAAYRATGYRVFLPAGAVDLRLDHPSPELGHWLETVGCRNFALITAYNPGSRRQPAADNRAAQARLIKQLAARGSPVLAARHVADSGDWPDEASCLVAGLPVSEVCTLAAEYGQNAVVCGDADGIPRLVWIEELER